GPRLVAADSAATVLEGIVRDASTRSRTRPALKLIVQSGACGRAVGAADVLEALRAAVTRRRLDAEVIDGACNGMCYAAPLIAVRRPGWPMAVIERMDAGGVATLVERLASDAAALGAGVAWNDRPWRGLTPVADHPFWRGQERVLMSRCGVVDPSD